MDHCKAKISIFKSFINFYEKKILTDWILEEKNTSIHNLFNIMKVEVL